MKIIKVNENHYKAQSRSQIGKFWDIHRTKNGWACNCYQFLFRNPERKPCAHLIEFFKQIKKGGEK